ncbi:hypothetical protein Emed_007492 [Eimeria media]
MAVALFLVLQCLRFMHNKANTPGATARFLAAGEGDMSECSEGPLDDDVPSAATAIQVQATTVDLKALTKKLTDLKTPRGNEPLDDIALEQMLIEGKPLLSKALAVVFDSSVPESARQLFKAELEKALNSAEDAINVLTPTWIEMLDLRRQLLEATYTALQNRVSAQKNKDEPLEFNSPVIRAIADLRSGLEVARHSHSDLSRFSGVPFPDGKLGESLTSLETLMTKADKFMRELVKHSVTLWKEKANEMEKAKAEGRATRSERKLLMEDAISALAALRRSSGLDLDLN